MAILDDLVSPFAINVASVYQNYDVLFDAIIACLLFVSLGVRIFGAMYKGKDGKVTREGKMIGVAVGLALTFALVVWEMRTGWRFSSLGMLAALIVFILIGMFLYQLLVGALGDDQKQCAFAITYFLIYGMYFFSQSNWYMYGLREYRIVWSALTLVFLFSFIRFIMCAIGMFGSGKPDHGDEHTTPHGAEHTGPAHHGTDHADLPAAPTPPHADPIRVTIVQPRIGARYREGEDVPIEAHISGGDGHYEWMVFVRPNAQPQAEQRQGRGDHVATVVHGLQVGRHIIVVAAGDGRNHPDDRSVVVEVIPGHGDEPGHGRDTHAGDHPATEPHGRTEAGHGSISVTATRNGSPAHPATAELSNGRQTLHRELDTHGHYVFENLEPGDYTVAVYDGANVHAQIRPANPQHCRANEELVVTAEFPATSTPPGGATPPRPPAGPHTPPHGTPAATAPLTPPDIEPFLRMVNEYKALTDMYLADFRSVVELNHQIHQGQRVESSRIQAADAAMTSALQRLHTAQAQIQTELARITNHPGLGALSSDEATAFTEAQLDYLVFQTEMSAEDRHLQANMQRGSHPDDTT